jgi:hypothetical protein
MPGRDGSNGVAGSDWIDRILYLPAENRSFAGWS